MSVNAKTVNQRLDDIEKRLEKIEESLKALDFLNNLTQDLATEPKKIQLQNQTPIQVKLNSHLEE